jgi:hypothetical protein
MGHSARRACSNSVRMYGLLTFLSSSLSLIFLNHTVLTSYTTATETDPAGSQCLYSISDHVLQCTSNRSRQMGRVIVGPENVTSGNGNCRDNPQCVGRKYKWMGPIEPGKYRMNRDTRGGHAERFRLEPIPPRPGWRLWLPSWMPGSLRGGFLLGLGDLVSHGCIQVLKEDGKTSAQYRKMLELLEPQPTASNELVVVP